MKSTFYLVSVNKFNYYCRDLAAVKGCLERYKAARNNTQVTLYSPQIGSVAVDLEGINYASR